MSAGLNAERRDRLTLAVRASGPMETMSKRLLSARSLVWRLSQLPAPKCLKLLSPSSDYRRWERAPRNSQPPLSAPNLPPFLRRTPLLPCHRCLLRRLARSTLPPPPRLARPRLRKTPRHGLSHPSSRSRQPGLSTTLQLTKTPLTPHTPLLHRRNTRFSPHKSRCAPPRLPVRRSPHSRSAQRRADSPPRRLLLAAIFRRPPPAKLRFPQKPTLNVRARSQRAPMLGRQKPLTPSNNTTACQHRRPPQTLSTHPRRLSHSPTPLKNNKENQ